MRRKKYEDPRRGPLFAGVMTPRERRFVRKEMRRKKARRRRRLFLLAALVYLVRKWTKGDTL